MEDDMTHTPDNGGPAFPNPALADEAFHAPYDMSGMSLRDYFAGQALGGLAHDVSIRQIGDVAYEYADAMLKARGVQS